LRYKVQRSKDPGWVFTVEIDRNGGCLSRMPLFLNRRKLVPGNHLGRPSSLRGGSGAEKSVSTP
jgi:hypothetical protein